MAASKEGADSGWALSCESGQRGPWVWAQVQLSSLQPSIQQSSSGVGFACSRHLNFFTYYNCLCVCTPWVCVEPEDSLQESVSALLSLMSSACALDIFIMESRTVAPCVWFSH